jgi:hypothetical protein
VPVVQNARWALCFQSTYAQENVKNLSIGSVATAATLFTSIYCPATNSELFGNRCYWFL